MTPAGKSPIISVVCWLSSNGIRGTGMGMVYHIKKCTRHIQAEYKSFSWSRQTVGSCDFEDLMEGIPRASNRYRCTISFILNERFFVRNDQIEKLESLLSKRKEEMLISFQRHVR